jgi:hypothetical protein
VPPAVALLNHISSGILWRIFCQTGIFAGFSLYIINFVGRISEAAIAGDILLFSLGGQVGDYTGTHTVIFRGIFSIYYKLLARRNSEAAMGGSGVGGRGGGTLFFRVPNSLEGCNGWGQGWGILYILYIKASVVQWKDRPWRPEFGLEGKHFLSGNSRFFYFCGAAKLRWGGAQRPVGRGNEPKKTDARSARVRTRGQNPLVV